MNNQEQEKTNTESASAPITVITENKEKEGLSITVNIKDLTDALRIEKALDFYYQTECFWVKDWNEEMKKGNDFHNRISSVLNTRNSIREEIKKLLPSKEFID